MTRLKDILKEQGKTLNDLAEMLGVSRQALSKQVQGKMLVETAQRIADALNVNLWELFVDPQEVANVTQDNSTMTCPHCGKPIKIELKA